MTFDPEKNSLFDVLYADTRRISSLLSQFSDDGVITEVTRAASDVSTSDVDLSIKILKTKASESGSTNVSRRIDPKWLLPLLFLDQAQDIIKRDISEAAMGSLTLTSGSLVVTDLSILQQMWKSPMMKRQILSGMTQGEDNEQNRHERRAAKTKKSDTSEQEAILEMLHLLPHMTQANIVTKEFSVWCTIDKEFLVGDVAELVLKHGSKIAGHWSVVGILDARPFEDKGEDADYDEILSFDERLRIGMFLDNVWKVAADLAPSIRQALGRPFFSYGITPLIIFREINI